MACLTPSFIPKPGMRDKPMSRVPGLSRDYRNDYLVVPCGKCINCLKRRQNDFAVRVRAEAEKRGTMQLITLTYNNDNLPLVSTLWKVHKDTGEYERLTDPDFVCYSRKEDFFGYRKEMAQIASTREPRYIEVPLGDFDDLVIRITPSVCREDTKNWLKRCRQWYKREYGIDANFSYALVSEYGPQKCRPHYHCVLLGLSKEDAEAFCRLWKFGYISCDNVLRSNPDGTDGFTRAAEYIGKYVSKGVFECQSVKDCTAVGCRMCTSKGLGNDIVKKFRNYLLAFDMVGVYDPDTFFVPDKQRYLSRQELANLCSEIPKRLSVSYDGKRYFAIPRILRNKVFYIERKSEKGNVTYKRPTRVWRMVADAIQSQYVELDRREFERFCAYKSGRELVEAVASFNEIQASSARLSNDIGVKDMQMKYSKVKTNF